MKKVYVDNCGYADRTIYINKDNPKIIHIGCFAGTKQETIERITNAYKCKSDRDAYIAKVKECFSKVPYWWHFRFSIKIQLTEKFKNQLTAIVIGTTTVNITTTLFLAILSGVFNAVLDPLSVYYKLLNISLFYAYCYAAIWLITISGLLIWIINGIKIRIN